MLELLGAEYLIDHIVCENNKNEKELAYKVYTSDMLKALAKAWGMDVDVRYIDVITKEEPEEEQTGDEIVIAVMQKAGLKGKQDGRNELSGEAVT